jgi:hypothetical protein
MPALLSLAKCRRRLFINRDTFAIPLSTANFFLTAYPSPFSAALASDRRVVLSIVRNGLVFGHGSELAGH